MSRPNLTQPEVAELLDLHASASRAEIVECVEMLQTSHRIQSKEAADAYHEDRSDDGRLFTPIPAGEFFARYQTAHPVNGNDTTSHINNAVSAYRAHLAMSGTVTDAAVFDAMEEARRRSVAICTWMGSRERRKGMPPSPSILPDLPPEMIREEWKMPLVKVPDGPPTATETERTSFDAGREQLQSVADLVGKGD